MVCGFELTFVLEWHHESIQIHIEDTRKQCTFIFCVLLNGCCCRNFIFQFLIISHKS